MSDELYSLTPRSAGVFAFLIVCSLLISHYGIVAWNDPYWILQRQIVALVGIVANVAIIYYHITTPPHPKFLLSPKRKIMVRAHAMLGISEVLLGVMSYFFPESSLGMAFAIFAILHALTSFIQTPAVFGAKAIMIPSYFFASTLHLYCGYRLLMEPHSMFWMMNTFLTLNIYAYVRVFMLIFEKAGLFKDNHYSASVLFSGIPILPALMGPIWAFWIAGYIWLFTLVCRVAFRASKEEMDELWTERVRVGFVNETQKREWLLENIGEVPAEDLRVNREFVQRIFSKLDKDHNGTLEEAELAIFFQEWGLSKKATASIMHHVSGEVDFKRFFSLIRSANLLSEDLKVLQRESCETDEDRAKVIFDELDFDNSGYIERVELEMLLIDYGLPRTEVEVYLAKHDPDNDGRISFDEFYEKFEPLWKFAYYTVA